MSDGEVQFMKYVVITFCIVFSLSLGSCQLTNYQIRKSIEGGASAVEAACALNAESSTSICTIQALKEG